MEHFMHLNDKPFQSIWNGCKTIELRLYDEKRQQICIGDRIIFENLSKDGCTIVTEVIALHFFVSFEKLYASLPLEKCGYDCNNIKTAAASDMNAYYSPEEQLKYGVIGIEFVVKDKKTIAL